MVKPFHQWVAEQENTYEDNTWTGQQLDRLNKKQDLVGSLTTYTTTQLKAELANRLVGIPTSEDDLTTWMEIFCATVTNVTGGSGRLVNCVYADYDCLHDQYVEFIHNTDGAIKAITFYQNLMKLVADGWELDHYPESEENVNEGN